MSNGCAIDFFKKSYVRLNKAIKTVYLTSFFFFHRRKEKHKL